jgi:hypothetical protein
MIKYIENNGCKINLNHETWMLGLFFHILAWEKFAQNSDLFILVGGNVGSGKSATAVFLANHLDSTFYKNMESRILFNSHQLHLFEKFIKQRKAIMEKWFDMRDYKEKPLMQCFVIDEGQNILYRRNASTKINKKLIADIKTMRYLNSIIFVCIPDPHAIDSDLINRFDALIIPEKKADGSRFAHVWINGLRDYNGRLGYCFQMIEQAKKEKIRLSFDVNLLYANNIPLADIIGKVKYSNKVYEKYESLKIRNSFPDDEEGGEEQNIKEEARTINTEFTIIRGGSGIIVEKPKNELHTENFYDYKVLAKLLNITVDSLRHKLPNAGIEGTQKGKRKYWLLKDVLALYNINYEKQ